ncbi:MAG: C25 family cysteine peptidase [Flavobacteriales bacterium]|nr:C25 family cysteine peptidase [Flavobacteriales bacterium]
MKKNLLFLSILITQVLQSQTVLSEQNGIITVLNSDAEITFNGVGEGMVIPEIIDGNSLLKAGTPDVPKKTAALIVDDFRQMEVHVTYSEYTEYQDIHVAPSKGNLLRNIDPSQIAFEFGGVYNQDAFFPGNLVSLGEAYVQRQYRGQSLYFYPVQYNPVTKVLRHYTAIEVVVVPIDTPGANPLPATVPNRTNAVMDELYKSRFINYNEHSARYDVVGELGNMLVITDAEYQEEIAPWVTWKKEKGISTEVVDVSTIGGISGISAFIEDYYNENGVTYVVLVGDEDQIPTLLVNNSGGQGYCDACYSYVSGNDSYGEFFLGRLLVHTDDELVVFIDKILEYEKNPYIATDWFSIGVGIGSNEGAGIGDDGEEDWQHANETKEDLLSFTYTSVWELYESTHTTSSPTGGETADEAGNPSSSDLSDIINNGCSLINYTGHGNHSIISTTGFTNASINGLTNYNKYPYFIIVGCCVGDFDDDSGSGDTFGEAWIKADNTNGPTGGIGGAFSSVFQSWAPPMEGQDEMNHVIADMVSFETRHTLGSIHNHGCASMNDVYGVAGDDMTDTWHLFADPSIQLRTAFPSQLVVDHFETAFLGVSELDVLCDTEDAMIALTIDGEIIGTAIVIGGMATVTFDPIVSPSNILVTATSFNTIPYQGYVTLIVADGPYVIDDLVVIDDTNGNVNELADHGESILLDISLENVGIETAFGVLATLSSNDPWVTITDDFHFYGDILAASDLMAEGAYAFDVIDGVQDQHIAQFALNIVDSNENTWVMSFNVVLNAPVLSCGEFTIADESGNGMLEEGEIATFSFEVMNTGHASTTIGLDALFAESSPFAAAANTSFFTQPIAANESIVVTFDITLVNEVPDGALFEFDFSAGTAFYSAACSFEEVMNIIMEDWESGDINSFPWSLEGDTDWFSTDLNPYDGDLCMQSGVIGDGDQTILKLTLDFIDAGDVNFAFKTSSEAGWDELQFKIDGSTLGAWSGETAWTEVTFPISVGTHTLRWTYDKDDFCCVEGQDAVWVDNISFPSFNPISVTKIQGESFDLSIYPNPSSDILNLAIVLDKPETVSYEIIDAMGRVIISQQFGLVVSNGETRAINISDLSSGMYVMKTHAGDRVVVKEFVKL